MASRIASAGVGTRLGRESTRPMARARSRFRAGSGAVALSGPLSAGVLEREQEEPDLVGEVDPGLEERAVAERPAREQAEGADHPRERAALRREHDPGPDEHDPRARRRAQRGGLPVAAQLGEEPLPGRGALVEDLVAAVAVEPDGARGHEHGRAALPEDVGHGAARVDPARAKRALPRRRPARVERLAREVHAGVGALELGLPRPGPRRIPGDDADAGAAAAHRCRARGRAP